MYQTVSVLKPFHGVETEFFSKKRDHFLHRINLMSEEFKEDLRRECYPILVKLDWVADTNTLLVSAKHADLLSERVISKIRSAVYGLGIVNFSEMKELVSFLNDTEDLRESFYCIAPYDAKLREEYRQKMHKEIDVIRPIDNILEATECDPITLCRVDIKYDIEGKPAPFFREVKGMRVD